MKIKYIRVILAGLIASTFTAASAQTSATWGTLQKPFAATSPWNSRPVNPVFGSFTLPTSANANYLPSIDDGDYSLGVFQALPTDPAVTVTGATSAGVVDTFYGSAHNITIAHWPANVVPAAGTDGHADIVDEELGIIHSFWYLRNTNGAWTAKAYGWSRLDGQGFGDPAHVIQGARAAGVPSMAGIIRLSEVNDGKPYYEHALAMSLQKSALSGGSGTVAYIAPATTADTAFSTNTGAIPEGALMMLPASFNADAITDPALRKVAATLKLYGAYVVDRNGDTAYCMYVENGGSFNISSASAVNQADLDSIRTSLRKVDSASSWLDGDGNVKPAATNPNVLNYNGTWALQLGPNVGSFNVWKQMVEFPAAAKSTVLANYNSSVTQVNWAKLAAGDSVTFTAVTTGGAAARLLIKVGYSATSAYWDTGYLLNGNSSTFTWPTSTSGATIVVSTYAQSGIGSAPSTVSATLTKQ